MIDIISINGFPYAWWSGFQKNALLPASFVKTLMSPSLIQFQYFFILNKALNSDDSNSTHEISDHLNLRAKPFNDNK